MRVYLLFILLVPTSYILKNIPTSDDSSYNNDFTTLVTKSQEAFEFCKQNNFDTSFCILIDMSIHSGKNRLFIWGFSTNSVLNKGLCSHGCGENSWGEDETKTFPKFSNTPDSHKSSLGKYKIGKRGYSQWGIHVNYKLHGLDSSNDKAYKRVIVLHSWDMVQNSETYPKGSPEGWGCPAVSNEMMKIVDNKLQKTKNPVLLWIYK